MRQATDEGLPRSEPIASSVRSASTEHGRRQAAIDLPSSCTAEYTSRSHRGRIKRQSKRHADRLSEGAAKALEPSRGNTTTQASAYQSTRSAGLAGVLPKLRHLCGPRADAGQYGRG